MKRLFGKGKEEAVVKRLADDKSIGSDVQGNHDFAVQLNMGTPEMSKMAAKAILKRIQHKKAKVVLLSLTLLETLMRECGEPFHVHVGTREFLGILRRIALHESTDPQVCAKIAHLLQSWGESFRQHPRLPLFSDALESLRASGILAFPSFVPSMRFRPHIQPPIPASSLGSTLPGIYPSSQHVRATEIPLGSPVPPPRQDVEEAEMRAALEQIQMMEAMEASQRSQRSHQSSVEASSHHTSSSTNTAVVQEDALLNPAHEWEQHLESIKVLRNHMLLLDEIVGFAVTSSDVVENDVAQASFRVLKVARPKLVALIEDVSDDSAMVALLVLNDDVNRCIKSVERAMRGDAPQSAVVGVGGVVNAFSPGDGALRRRAPATAAQSKHNPFEQPPPPDSFPPEEEEEDEFAILANRTTPSSPKVGPGVTTASGDPFSSFRSMDMPVVPKPKPSSSMDLIVEQPARVQPVFDPFAQPIGVAQPVQQQFAQPVQQQRVDPFAQPVQQQRVDPFAQPVQQQRVDPFAQPVQQQRVDPFAQPIQQQFAQPVQQQGFENTEFKSQFGQVSTSGNSPMDAFAELAAFNPAAEQHSSQRKSTELDMFDPFA